MAARGTDDQQVLLDYCMANNVWAPTHSGVVEVQWAYRKALEAPPGSLLRALSRRVAQGRRVNRISFGSTSTLAYPEDGEDDDSTLIRDPKAWAAGDGLREYELNAAACVASWEGTRDGRIWTAPLGSSVESLWDAFVATATAASRWGGNYPRLLVGMKWPGVDRVGEALEAMLRGSGDVRYVPNGLGLVVYEPSPGCQLRLNLSDVELDSTPSLTAEAPLAALRLFQAWCKAAVDSLCPPLAPPA